MKNTAYISYGIDKINIMIKYGIQKSNISHSNHL